MSNVVKIREGLYRTYVNTQDGTETSDHPDLRIAVFDAIHSERVLNNTYLSPGDVSLNVPDEEVPKEWREEKSLESFNDWKDGSESLRISRDLPPTKAELTLLRELRRGAISCLEFDDDRLRMNLKKQELELLQKIREGALKVIPFGSTETGEIFPAEYVRTFHQLITGNLTILETSDYNLFQKWKKYHGK